MNNIPTPHISAKAGDFAETVLMPGDPKRAKFIAETYLNDAVLVNNMDILKFVVPGNLTFFPLYLKQGEPAAVLR